MGGQFQAEKEVYTRQMEERHTIASDLISKHKFSGFSNANLSASDINRFIHRLQEECHSFDTSSKRTRQGLKDNENGLVSEVSRLSSLIASLDENKRITSYQMASIDDKIDNCMRRQGGMHQCQQDLDEVTINLESEQSCLLQLNSSNSISDSEQSLNSLSSQLQHRELAAQTMRDEMATLNVQADARARLMLKKTDEQRKGDMLNRM